MSWNKIIECVPNFSEGRDLEKIDQIVAPFRSKAGVKLLDYSNDEDHNRLVVTLVGEPEALYEAIPFVSCIGERVPLIAILWERGRDGYCFIICEAAHTPIDQAMRVISEYSCKMSASNSNER